MKEKRNWTGKFIFIILLQVLMAAVTLPAVKTKAAYAGNSSEIGTYINETGGESITGVKISKNGQVVYYALDTWRKANDSEWKYTGSNIDGSVSEIESSINSPVYIKGTQETRFGVNIGKIKEYLPEKGSVIIKKYVYGKCTYNYAEFTYQDNESNPVDISESLLKQLGSGTLNLDLDSTKYKYNSASYLYDIYDAAVISRNGDIKADIPADCTILSEGYAYYGIEGEYIIRELPQIGHDPEEGCTFTFKGWYTSPAGGDKVNTGDAIETGTTIYPQWNKTLNSYNVNCIDILGSNPGGQVLGSKSWTVNYNDKASGSDIGNDNTAGTYYKGLCYTDCTSTTVKNDCDVYRYFRPVSYDIIFNGNSAVSGATASLYGCLYGEKYILTENGYSRNGTITLDLNAEDAVCPVKNINVPYKFTGWADTASGKAIYADGSEVSSLCQTDGEKHLYAVWEGGHIEIKEIPVRAGYNFDGWSKEQDSTTGSIYFDVADVNNCTLYAIWKPLKAKYSVEYYIEDNKGGYILSQKAEYEAFTGYEADFSSNLYIKEHYSQYILDKDKSIYKGTVKHDGSLLLQCYLKKKTSGSINTENTGNGTGSTEDSSTVNGTDSSNTGNSGNAGSSGNTGGTGGSIEGNVSQGNTSGSSIGENTSQETVSGGSIGSGGNGNSGNTGSTGSGNIGNGNSGNSNITGGSTGSISGSAGSGGGSTGGSGGSTGGIVGGTGNIGGSTDSISGSTGSNSNDGNSAGSASGDINSGSKEAASGGSIGSSNSSSAGSGAEGSNNKNNGVSGSGDNYNSTNGNNYTGHNGGNKVNKKGSSSKKKISYPKPGKKYTKSKIIYKVIKSNNKSRTVHVVKAKKSITRVKIPAFIKIKGSKYKVVSIAKNAFVKCNKLRKAVIGKNIKSIGKKAFYKNRGLGNIKIKSKKLKSVGKGAFKNIKPRCTVKIAGNKEYASKVFSMISAKS